MLYLCNYVCCPNRQPFLWQELQLFPEQILAGQKREQPYLEIKHTNYKKNWDKHTSGFLLWNLHVKRLYGTYFNFTDAYINLFTSDRALILWYFSTQISRMFRLLDGLKLSLLAVDSATFMNKRVCIQDVTKKLRKLFLQTIGARYDAKRSSKAWLQNVTQQRPPISL